MADELNKYIVPPHPIADEHLNMFSEFLADDYETEMYISGEGGSGKTTLLVHLIRELYTRNLGYVVGAYTHQACRVLRDKIYVDPIGADAQTEVKTVHSFLKKMPGIDEASIDINKLQVTIKNGEIEPPKVLIFDEYSMIGEDDYMSIGEITTDDTGKVLVKVVYIGDAMQLPPVKSARTIKPRGDYQLTLKVNHRADADLQPTLDALRRMKETGVITSLPESNSIKRKADIVEDYAKMYSEHSNNLMLAYTNRAVDVLNTEVHEAIHNSTELLTGDDVFVDTRKKVFAFNPFNDFIEDDTLVNIAKKYKMCGTEAIKLSKHVVIELNSGRLLGADNDKYNTIPFILRNFDCCIIPSKHTTVVNGKKVQKLALKPYVFGNMQYKDIEMGLRVDAVNSNLVIESLIRGDTNTIVSKDELRAFCKENKSLPEVRARNDAWRLYMSFNDSVTMLSRPYASTVHKAQGSTVDNVFIDGTDMLKLYKRNPKEYLSLFYTAISRAKHLVYISN